MTTGADGTARTGGADDAPPEPARRRSGTVLSFPSKKVPTWQPVDAEESAPRPTMEELRTELAARRAEIVAGRPDAVARQERNGKRTARQRLELLLDEGSLVELDLHRRAEGTGPSTDGVVAGSGTVDGRRVVVYAQDFTVSGGSLGRTHAAKIHKVLDLAIATGCPVIALNDSGGARIQEGVLALDGCGGMFRRQVTASGVVPQISVVLGPCAGAAAYSPALADVVFMVRDIAQMYLTGPDVVAAVTGEAITHEELGGADVHGVHSGVATVIADDEESCFAELRYLMSLLPLNNTDLPPDGPQCGASVDVRPRLAELVPPDPRAPYDMRDVIAEIVDTEWFEMHERWAANVVCGLARIDGQVVGIVGNQPMVMAGVLDREASQKAARFVRFCDAFNISLVTLVDVPGFLPGSDQERAGIIRHGAQLLYAYSEATVPRIQVIVRKSYGGAYIVMDSRSIGCDIALAWPTNEIAVMGAEGAVNVLHRKALANSSEPAVLREMLVKEYTDTFMHPQYAAEHGLIDDIIDPVDTRAALARSLAVLRTKRADRAPRKHGNVPL